MTNNITWCAVLAHMEVDSLKKKVRCVYFVIVCYYTYPGKAGKKALARGNSATNLGGCLPNDLGEVRVLGIGGVVLGYT